MLYKISKTVKLYIVHCTYHYKHLAVDRKFKAALPLSPNKDNVGPSHQDVTPPLTTIPNTHYNQI